MEPTLDIFGYCLMPHTDVVLKHPNLDRIFQQCLSKPKGTSFYISHDGSMVLVYANMTGVY